MNTAKKKEPESEKKVPATPRNPRRFYEILDVYEAGLSLTGPEVKSLRAGRASLDGSCGRQDKGELFLFNFYLPPYAPTRAEEAPESRRSRKLLLHGRKIEKISQKLQVRGLSLVPLEVYFR